MGCENTVNAGNVGLKRVKRKTYESCVKLRKLRCNFSNRILMT